MKVKLAYIIAILIGLSFIGVADADGTGFGSQPSLGSFDDTGSGSIVVYVNNTEGYDQDITVVVIHNISFDRLAEKTVTVPASATDYAIDVAFGFQQSGTEYINIELYDSSSTLIDSQSGIPISVSHSLWKDSSTYIVIIVVIVVIVVVAYLIMRNAPKRKADKLGNRTFTEMQASKKQTAVQKSGKKR